jgi:tripartite-type tricarboxylate transporter receptor subunit TctC
MKAALRPFVLVVLVLLTGIAKADNWPTRPIKFVVPFGPGIGIDIMARTVAERLSRKLGQPVIVENIPGAGNILGAQAVARAAPDGYTFLFTGPSPVVTNIFAFKSLPYDPYRDFTAVAMISEPGPFVISVNPKLPVATLPELLTYVRARPGQLHYAIDGSAIFQSVVARSFAKRAGIDLVELGYRTIASLAGHGRRIQRNGFQLRGGERRSRRGGQAEADRHHLKGPLPRRRGSADRRGDAARIFFRGIHPAAGARGPAG